MERNLKSDAVESPSRQSEERDALDAFLSTRSEAAFNTLAVMLFTKLVRYFAARGLEIATGEELAQNVLMTVYCKIQTLKDKNNFYGWFYKIATNEHLQYHRQRQRDIQTLDLDCVLAETRLRLYEQPPFDTEFLEWIASLEADEQHILILRYIEELTYDEIASALELPLGTVKWKLFDAKMKLAGILNESRSR